MNSDQAKKNSNPQENKNADNIGGRGHVTYVGQCSQGVKVEEIKNNVSQNHNTNHEADGDAKDELNEEFIENRRTEFIEEFKQIEGQSLLTKPTGKSHNSTSLLNKTQTTNPSPIRQQRINEEVVSTVTKQITKIPVPTESSQVSNLSYVKRMAEETEIQGQNHKESVQKQKIAHQPIQCIASTYADRTQPNIIDESPPRQSLRSNKVSSQLVISNTKSVTTPMKPPEPKKKDGGTAHEVPICNTEKQKPKELRTSKEIVQKSGYFKSAFTESDGHAPYDKVVPKLASTGPLSIINLNEFLKKSKTDFEHLYNDKSINNLQITDFDLIKILGIGAFGKVVLGEFKKDKTHYALKIIDKQGVIKRHHIRYVSNEKRILQGLNFPFVTYLRYFFTDFYYLYFVMPYIPGGNFATHMKHCQKLKESEATFYIGQLVLALEYLHYLELIHRDVKLDNIMIDAFGYLKLVDFGQCVRCHGYDKTWTFTGTPDYMAPEIIIRKGYDCAVDWWALGIITFELCAGFRPFKHENTFKLQLLILSNRYTIPNNFSNSLKKLTKSLLEEEPKKRIANNTKKASAIKKHVWFKEINWLALLNRNLEAPYLPKLQKLSEEKSKKLKD